MSKKQTKYPSQYGDVTVGGKKKPPPFSHNQPKTHRKGEIEISFFKKRRGLAEGVAPGDIESNDQRYWVPRIRINAPPQEPDPPAPAPTRQQRRQSTGERLSTHNTQPQRQPRQSTPSHRHIIPAPAPDSAGQTGRPPGNLPAWVPVAAFFFTLFLAWLLLGGA